MASQKNGIVYIGVTNNLLRRMIEHKNKLGEGFTKTYNVDKLVYYEQTENIEEAIIREKQLKKWESNWKIELIESCNPLWNDLQKDLL